MLKLLKSQKGFTLVELMVVILIIAILIAVAVPIYLNVRNRGYDNVVKQALTNASRAAASAHASDGSWPTLAGMDTEEPSYSYQVPPAAVGTGANPEGTLGYEVVGGVMTLSGASISGSTFTITGNANGTLTRGW